MGRDSIEAIASNNSGGFSCTFDEEPVFSADALTPAQFYRGVASSPCQRLLAAVLEEAIRCFLKNFGAATTSRQVIFHEAEEWLFDTDAAGFMSCPMVCESLGIDAAQLRQYLREWQRRVKSGQDAPRLRRRSSVPADPIISTASV